jgi:L-threonylcarbamoyladenylate synthase
MALSISIQRASRILRDGGVVAYPTEGVFGLGCLPHDATAVRRILAIKQRDPAKGLVLIAADLGQLDEWIEVPSGTDLPTSRNDRPVTWVVPAAADVSYLVRGNHQGLAVRLTAHPVAAALCNAADSPLVSTSANISGRPPARNSYVLRRLFGDLVDYVVPGTCGPASGQSEIRDLLSGKVLRPANR